MCSSLKLHAVALGGPEGSEGIRRDLKKGIALLCSSLSSTQWPPEGPRRVTANTGYRA